MIPDLCPIQDTLRTLDDPTESVPEILVNIPEATGELTDFERLD